MTSALARRFKVDVSTDGTTWIPFKGVQDLAPSEKPTLQSTSDYDTDGFESNEKTMTGWSVVVKANRPVTTGVFDPGQELVRAAQFQFGDAARCYVRYYDRNNAPEAWSGRALVTYVESKTGVADVEEITVTFDGDGVLSKITNPSTNPTVAVVTSATPSAAGTGALVRIQGAYFTGTTSVKFGATAATVTDIVSDSMIEAVVPSGTAGSAAITVTNSAGTSTAFPYTRAA